MVALMITVASIAFTAGAITGALAAVLYLALQPGGYQK